MVGTSNQSVPESWPLIKYYIQLLAPRQSTVQDQLLDLLLDIPLPTANHGAEFYLPTFTSILWPSDVGVHIPAPCFASGQSAGWAQVTGDLQKSKIRGRNLHIDWQNPYLPSGKLT